MISKILDFSDVLMLYKLLYFLIRKRYGKICCFTIGRLNRAG